LPCQCERTLGGVVALQERDVEGFPSRVTGERSVITPVCSSLIYYILQQILLIYCLIRSTFSYFIGVISFIYKTFYRLIELRPVMIRKTFALTYQDVFLNTNKTLIIYLSTKR
jgi:hypothetical protein